MAFPASVEIQAEALSRLRNAALELKRSAQRDQDKMADGPVTAADILTTLNRAKSAIEVFDVVAVIPGIEPYAQAQYDDSNLDLTAEFSSMRSAAVNARDWIVNNLPADSDGYLLLQTVDDMGNLSWRSFTSQETAGLRTKLQTIIDSVS